MALLLPGTGARNGDEDVPQGEPGLSVSCSEAFPGLRAGSLGASGGDVSWAPTAPPAEVTEPHSRLGCCFCVAGCGAWGAEGHPGDCSHFLPVLPVVVLRALCRGCCTLL